MFNTILLSSSMHKSLLLLFISVYILILQFLGCSLVRFSPEMCMGEGKIENIHIIACLIQIKILIYVLDLRN